MMTPAVVRAWVAARGQRRLCSQPTPVSLREVIAVRARVAVRDAPAARSGNIVMELISVYGVQALYAAFVLALIVGAYLFLTRLSATSDVRVLVSAVQDMHSGDGNYTGLTTKILANSERLTAPVVAGDEIWIGGAELQVFVFPGSDKYTNLKANSTRLWVLHIGDNAEGISDASVCAELATLSLPKLKAIAIIAARAAKADEDIGGSVFVWGPRHNETKTSVEIQQKCSELTDAAKSATLLFVLG